MKNYLRNLLALLVCAALLALPNSAVLALADELEIELADSSQLDSILEEPELTISGEYLFSGDLEQLLIGENDAPSPDAQANLEDSDFNNVDGICYYIDNGKALVSGPGHYNDGTKEVYVLLEDLVVPSVVMNYPVVAVDMWAFDNATYLKSVSLPGSVTTIEESAFRNCSSLTDVTLSNGLVEMCYAVFEGCKALKNITLPETLGDIGSNCFKDCSSLTSITIPEGVGSVGEEAFSGCANLESVTFVGDCNAWMFPPSNIFEGCPKLTIHGNAGSYIEKYAVFYGIPFDDGTTSISITNGANAELEIDNTLQLQTEVIPSNPKVTRIWTSSDENIAIVSEDGLVTGIAKGKATITVTTRNGKTDSIEITVVEPQPKKITITNGKTISVDVDSKKQLKTQLTPANAETMLTWTSSDNKIATVNAKGLVKGVKKGSATITVTTKNGKTASIKVKVVAPVPTKVIIKQGKSATLYMGSTLKLTTKFAPAKAESKLTWSSSKKAVATVSAKGVVTPKKAGKTKITVKTANGKKASITVKVVDAQSVKLKEGKGKTLKVGQKLTLHATVSPAKVKTKLTWNSSDAKVATVSSKGVVTAKKAGTAKITAKTANGKSATITITVK